MAASCKFVFRLVFGKHALPVGTERVFSFVSSSPARGSHATKKARNPMKKRLVSLLLAIAMMVVLFPTTVWAEGENGAILSTDTISILLNKPNSSTTAPIYTISTGYDRIAYIKYDDKTAAMDLYAGSPTSNVCIFYVVGNPAKDLIVKTGMGYIYNVPVVMFSGNSSEISLPGAHPLEIGKDGYPDISKMSYYTFEGLDRKTYSGNNWEYNVSSSSNTLTLFETFNGSVGSNPVRCDVFNQGTITGGIFLGYFSNHGNAVTNSIFVNAPYPIDYYTVSVGSEGNIIAIKLGDNIAELTTPVKTIYVTEDIKI